MERIPYGKHTKEFREEAVNYPAHRAGLLFQKNFNCPLFCSR